MLLHAHTLREVAAEVENRNAPRCIAVDTHESKLDERAGEYDGGVGGVEIGQWQGSRRCRSQNVAAGNETLAEKLKKEKFENARAISVRRERLQRHRWQESLTRGPLNRVQHMCAVVTANLIDSDDEGAGAQISDEGL